MAIWLEDYAPDARRGRHRLPCALRLALDLELRLRERSHDGEDHVAHRRGGVAVAAAEIEDAHATATAKLLGEVKHALGRTPEPDEDRDHEEVAAVERLECSIELSSRLERALKTP